MTPECENSFPKLLWDVQELSPQGIHGFSGSSSFSQQLFLKTPLQKICVRRGKLQLEILVCEGTESSSPLAPQDFGVFFGTSPFPSPSIPPPSLSVRRAGRRLRNKLINSARLGCFFSASTGLGSLQAREFWCSSASTTPAGISLLGGEGGRKFLESKEMLWNTPKSRDFQPLERSRLQHN